MSRALLTPGTELVRSLAVLADGPAPAVSEALGLGPIDPADHTEIFVFQAPPYASFYLDPGGMLGGEVAARIGGFWHALGYPVPEQPDHLSALLGLHAGLAERRLAADGARRSLLAQAGAALVDEHLHPWVGVYLDVIRSLAAPPWPEWADLVGEVMALHERGEPALARHLAQAPPPLDDWRDVRGLLTPVRSGIVVTRSDLVRCARSVGLGVRLTGRVPTLGALLDQAPHPTRSWLAGHAATWEERHRRRGSAVTDSFWADRAGRLQSLLGEAR